jgi:hypothetical protein
MGFQYPSSTATNKLSSTTITLPVITATQHPSTIATIKPTSTPTSLPEVTKTHSIFNVIQREYIPSEWKTLYDKHTVWQIDLDSKEQMWILTVDHVGYFDGNKWVLYSDKDYGLPDSYNHMAVASDGTVWVASPQAISQYQNGHWNVHSIPNAPEYSLPFLAVDSSNLVWLSLWACNCVDSLKTFDGVNWDNRSMTSFGKDYQLLFTPYGTMWASFYDSIGKYNGKTWKIYSENILWPEHSGYGIRIASDRQGNIFGIDYRQEWIVKITRDENILKIPFNFEIYKFNPMLMRLFIDQKGRIWTNACHNDHDCLEYYQDNHWISIRNLPFHTMTDMKELSDGTLLVATNKGLFQYNPGK